MINVKRKGNNFERYIVTTAKSWGVKAKRAWGSDGRSLGLHPEVDVVIGGYKGQAKARKSIADYIKPSEHVDVQIIKENRGEAYVVMRLRDFCRWVRNGDEDETKD